MGGRAVATIHGHAAALKRSVGNCQLFRKTPTIPPRGPMPLTDPVGMGLAVELLFHSLTATPRIKGESHIQFDSMRRPRSTFTSVGLGVISYRCSGGVNLHLEYGQSHCYIMPLPTGLVR
jgi:hypothetical protein